MDELQGEGWPDRQIARFWPRLGALAIDCVLLGIVGMLLGAVLFDPLARMGMYARLIGFAIALGYFGICNSRIGGGQTLGKRWLQVRVVDADGRLLSLPRSLLRYVVLGLPFFVNGLPLSTSQAMSPLGDVLALIVFGGMFAIGYLYVFNRRTRQSLHDLAVGSYVERFERTARPVPFPRIWRGHLIAIALIAAIALSIPVVAKRFLSSPMFAGMLPMSNLLSAQPHVMSSQVMRGWSSFNGHTTHSLQASLRLDIPATEDAANAKRIAQLMAKADPKIAEEDFVVVVLSYGYDMGIASGWKRQAYSFGAGELR